MGTRAVQDIAKIFNFLAQKQTLFGLYLEAGFFEDLQNFLQPRQEFVIGASAEQDVVEVYKDAWNPGQQPLHLSGKYQQLTRRQRPNDGI